MDNYIIGLLRASAAEIAESNICGWGNTMADAADEIESLRATISRLTSERDAAELFSLALKDKCDSTISRLREYAKHRYTCHIGHYNPRTGGDHPCNCGYDALLAALEETK